MKTRGIFAACSALAFIALAWILRPYDAGPLLRSGGTITFLDRNGARLGTLIGPDAKHTVDVPLSQMSAWFPRAILAAEDARFFSHGPVDGPALVRALTRGARERRLPHGGSTISMQLGRLLQASDPTFGGKLQEVLIAQRLENGYSKRDLLQLYCNRVPMGSNLYGIEAAARTYFGEAAADLDLAQAAALAALPNDPVALDPYRHRAALERRRRYVLNRMAAAGFITPVQASAAAGEHVALRARELGIVAAPHYLFHLASSVPNGAAVVQTSIDLPLQRFVESQTRAVVGDLADRDVNDAAAIVLDNRTGDVLAYAGSPDYFDAARLGSNDGVAALRQPGSALKPFLYALALASGTIRSNSILEDVHTTYALPGARLYEPADYSRTYAGPVRVRIALADSLNVPAVRVLERTGVDAFLRRLHELGFAHLRKPADYYGLGLALGGGEVSLEELARAYRSMAGARDDADLLVTDMLSDPYARAASFGVDSILRLPFRAAVKTGTSSGHRDTWAAGFTPKYTVATWVGNFDGSPMRGVSGVSGAAPLWARIMLHLHERAEPPPFALPRGYVRRAICARTGEPAAGGCRPAVLEWLRPADLAARRSVPAGGGGASFAIVYPHDGDRFASFPGTGAGRVRLQFSAQPAEVQVDGVPLLPNGDAFVLTLRAGRHRIEASGAGAHAAATIEVGPPLPTPHRGFS